jgi:hypothetical protein
MHELEQLAVRIERLTPLIGDALEDDGEPRTPDLEIPISWMGYLGHAIARSLDRLAPETARAVFDLLDEALASGSKLTGEAVATGLLEALANDLDRGVVTRDQLAPLLGPHSRAYLRAWDEFTLGSSTWADD